MIANITISVETGRGVTRSDLNKLKDDIEKYTRVVLLADRQRFVRPKGDETLPATWHQHKGKEGCSFCKDTLAYDDIQKND